MGKIINNIYVFVSRYKYLIVVVFGVLIVGFLDENSMLRKIEYEFEISDLKDQIAEYNKKYEQDQKKLKAIGHNPKLIERIAREKYLMKSDDEDIFILSTDLPEQQTQKDEQNDDSQSQKEK